MVIDDDTKIDTSETGGIKWTRKENCVTADELQEYLAGPSPERVYPKSLPKFPKVDYWIEEPSVVFDADVWCEGVAVYSIKSDTSDSYVLITKYEADWDFDKCEWSDVDFKSQIRIDYEDLDKFISWVNQ